MRIAMTPAGVSSRVVWLVPVAVSLKRGRSGRPWLIRYRRRLRFRSTAVDHGLDDVVAVVFEGDFGPRSVLLRTRWTRPESRSMWSAETMAGTGGVIAVDTVGSGR